MNAPGSSAVEHLDRLVHLCKEASYECSVAAGCMQDHPLRSVFEASSGEYATLARQLEERIKAVSPEETGRTVPDVPGSEGWSDLAAAVARCDQRAVLVACERGERVLLEAFAAAGEDVRLDDETGTLVRRQAAILAETHRRLKEIRDRPANENQVGRGP